MLFIFNKITKKCLFYFIHTSLCLYRPPTPAFCIDLHVSASAPAAHTACELVCLRQNNHLFLYYASRVYAYLFISTDLLSMHFGCQTAITLACQMISWKNKIKKKNNKNQPTNKWMKTVPRIRCQHKAIVKKWSYVLYVQKPLNDTHTG